MFKEFAKLEDGYSTLRGILAYSAEHCGEYAGIPMPLSHDKLVIEPTFKQREGLMGINKKEEVQEEPNFKVRNIFWSYWWRCNIVIMEEEDGRITHCKMHDRYGVKYEFQTMSASAAWGLEQEYNAQILLQDLIKPHLFKAYLLTGIFMETSKRSGIMYIFRRLKPTIAYKVGENRVLCTLCLHPIAYYEGSWAGAMCPTDDIIAHLMLMRGDEHLFWRRANQHPPYAANSGL